MAAAQRPAELVGRVAERGGAPIEAASLELVEVGARAVTDAAGRYRFRAVSAGRYTLRITRIGYGDRTLSVDLDGGRTRLLDLDLVPKPILLEGVDVAVAGPPPLGTRVDRGAIERSGARSAGDVLRTVPGVVVRSTAAGGSQTVSVRGSAANAVLVLVDGVAVNDPVSGEADLSTIAAGTIESVVLLPGAQSARYGPRSEAGVILIETRREDAERVVRASFGSLDLRSGSVVWGGPEPFAWSAGADWSAIGGTFDFDLPAEVGGGHGRRENSDARTLAAWLGGSAPLAAGTLRVRGAAESARRGLPGRGYAPSRDARQDVDRLQGAAAWRRLADRTAGQMSVTGARHTTRFRDAAPAFGVPYDDTAQVWSLDLRAEAERRRARETGLEYGGGLEARWQRIEATALDATVPSERTDAGAFVHGGFAARLGGGLVALTAQLRADRDDQRDDWVVSRSLTLSLASGRGLHAHVAARSSYSPPTLGDQYFRDAVGIEPNPDLQAERVPAEVELGLRGERDFGSVRADFGATVYLGDVRGMIIWAPDFRFIWSPRNVDVNRVGAETRAGAEALDGRLRVGLTHSYARVTYDREGPEDAVQLVYRPRHTASVDVGWQEGPVRLDLDARFTGTRYPVPAPVNALPPFWTVSAAMARDWRVGDWVLTSSLRGDRLFDEDGALIFGFPEPGRVLRLDLVLRPVNPSENKGSR